MLRVIAISALLTGLVPGVARSAWLRPVPGDVVEAFDYSSGARFTRGQQRGLVLAAAPGTPVRSACAGRVVFAGSVGRAGPTASVQCGTLRATYQGLAATGIEQGETVRAGDVIGPAGPTGAIHLGARAGPGRYVDPATLFGGSRPTLGPAPGRRHPPRPPAPDPLHPDALGHRPTETPRRTASPSPHTPPALYLALALAAATLGPLTLRIRRQPARSPSSAAALPASASSAAARPSQP